MSCSRTKPGPVLVVLDNPGIVLCYFCRKKLDTTAPVTLVRKLVTDYSAKRSRIRDWNRIGYACPKCAERVDCNIVPKEICE